jgi:hypothetical protein
VCLVSCVLGEVRGDYLQREVRGGYRQNSVCVVITIVDSVPCGGQTILAEADEEGRGVILASMGTLCNFGTEEFRQIAKALSSLNYTVIWKVAGGDLPGNASVESLGIGSNVKVAFAHQPPSPYPQSSCGGELPTLRPGP